MRRRFFLDLPIAAAASLLSIACAPGSEARAETALEAVKQLPQDQIGQIARIEAREGTPVPDRWYILTQDPKAENGVHEYVVSAGEIIASRAVSQFAEKLTPADALGNAPLNIDSDKAAGLARHYAEANGAAVTSMNYELKKDGPDAAPAWTVTCMDDKGSKVGAIVVTAGKGNVVSHDGFPQEPAPAATPGDTPRKKEHDAVRFDTYAKPDVAVLATPSASPGEETVDEVDQGGHHHRHRIQKKKQPTGIAKTFQDVGRTLSKFNPF